MRFDVERGKKHQDAQWQQTVEQPAVAGVPSQAQQHYRHTHMTAGKSRRGTLSCIVSLLHELMEETFFPSWYRQAFAIPSRGIEVVDIGKDALRNLILTHHVIVELRSRDGYEVEDDIMDEKSTHNDKYRPLKLLPPTEEVKQ